MCLLSWCVVPCVLECYIVCYVLSRSLCCAFCCIPFLLKVCFILCYEASVARSVACWVAFLPKVCSILCDEGCVAHSVACCVAFLPSHSTVCFTSAGRKLKVKVKPREGGKEVGRKGGDSGRDIFFNGEKFWQRAFFPLHIVHFSPLLSTFLHCSFGEVECFSFHSVHFSPLLSTSLHFPLFSSTSQFFPPLLSTFSPVSSTFPPVIHFSSIPHSIFYTKGC